jgi:hypothetical protein
MTPKNIERAIKNTTGANVSVDATDSGINVFAYETRNATIVKRAILRGPYTLDSTSCVKGGGVEFVFSSKQL